MDTATDAERQDVNETQRKRVLLIEDEASVRKFLIMRLKNAGLDVSFAVDGAAGLQEVKSQIPDLIILDLLLPKMTGEEVCKAIKEGDDEELAKIPIIMLTAKDSIGDRIVGRTIGANAYLTKPFDFNELFREIKKLISLDS